MLSVKLSLVLALSLIIVSGAAFGKKMSMKEIKSFSPDSVVWTTDQKSGISTATQWGNPKTGPSAGLIKFPKGWTAPMHHHSSDHVVGMISGTFTVTDENGTEHRMTAGWTGTVPGKTKHSTKCGEEMDCVLFGYISGKDDMIPATTATH